MFIDLLAIDRLTEYWLTGSLTTHTGSCFNHWCAAEPLICYWHTSDSPKHWCYWLATDSPIRWLTTDSLPRYWFPNPWIDWTTDPIMIHWPIVDSLIHYNFSDSILIYLFAIACWSIVESLTHGITHASTHPLPLSHPLAQLIIDPLMAHWFTDWLLTPWASIDSLTPRCPLMTHWLIIHWQTNDSGIHKWPIGSKLFWFILD